jgi:hypothetical protein
MSLRDCQPSNIKIGDPVLFYEHGKPSLGTIVSFTDFPSLPYRIYWHSTQNYRMVDTESVISMRKAYNKFNASR